MEDNKNTEKILSQLKEDITPTRLNICIPKAYDKLLDKKSNDTGRPKTDIFLECFSTVFPENFEEFFGKEVFNAIVDKVRIFYNDIYENKGGMVLICRITENLRICDDEDVNRKSIEFAKHISDIVYPGDGETVNRNGLRKVLIQKDYAKQVSEAILKSIETTCDKAYAETLDMLNKVRFT